MREDYKDLLIELHENLKKVKFRCEQKDQKIANLESKLEQYGKTIELLQGSLEKEQNRYKQLVISRSMILSERDKNAAKVKLSTMMREIDQCIAQLKEI